VWRWSTVFSVSSVSEVRRNLSALIEQLKETPNPILITHYSKPSAVLMNYEDYMQLMERLEDLQDLRDMEAAEQEWRATGKGTSLQELKAQLS